MGNLEVQAEALGLGQSEETVKSGETSNTEPVEAEVKEKDILKKKKLKVNKKVRKKIRKTRW